MGRLIVVSNRVPSARTDAAGGLAVALKEALSSGGLWFGWSGRAAAERSAGALRIDGGFATCVVDLSEADVETYYHGYANRTLWPLLHCRLDIAAHSDADFAGYMDVNRYFANQIAPHIRADDVIWVHDYHLIPLGAELRRLGLRNRIGFFLHIPWPPAEIWQATPRHAELLEAFDAYDLVGLQTKLDADNFKGCVARDQARPGLAARVAAFPIGIATTAFATLAAEAVSHPLARRLAASLSGRRLIIGVDRLDYTKGIEERMESFERYLEATPAARRGVVFLQVTPKSRSEVPEYAELQNRVAAVAGRINGARGDLDWTPIRYVNRTVRRESLAGLLRMANVGLVTPLRDGMNLVAKEYVAAQDPEEPGVLVLSRFAGAADALDGALLVNPHDITATAAAIGEAVAMPREERIARWRTMFDYLAENDVNRWRAAFLAALEPAGQPLRRVV
jgi:trehalose 6-phosphate synthase